MPASCVSVVESNPCEPLESGICASWQLTCLDSSVSAYCTSACERVCVCVGVSVCVGVCVCVCVRVSSAVCCRFFQCRLIYLFLLLFYPYPNLNYLLGPSFKVIFF